MSLDPINNRAYVPFSKQQSFCIVESTSGKLFPGVRVENVSFPLTISAIQAACCNCLSEGEKPQTLYLAEKPYDQLEFWKTEFDLNVESISNDIVKRLEDQSKKAPEKELLRLKELLEHAVPIHSEFPVSALLYTVNGVFEGVNIEVSDWAMGLCAERVAISKALANGYNSFSSLAVHTRYGEVSSPCGACRQVIVEHLPLLKIRMHHSDDTLTEFFTNDLLPFSFTSNNLQK